MKLDASVILDEANIIYASKKFKKAGRNSRDIAYIAPELFPKIQSDQVVAILEALVNAINSDAKTK